MINEKIFSSFLLKFIKIITLGSLLFLFLPSGPLRGETLDSKGSSIELSGILNPAEINEASNLFKSWTDKEVINFFIQSEFKSEDFKKIYDSFNNSLIAPPLDEQQLSLTVDRNKISEIENLGRIIHNRLLALTRCEKIKYKELLTLMREIIFLQLKYLPKLGSDNDIAYRHWHIVHNAAIKLLNQEYLKQFPGNNTSERE